MGYGQLCLFFNFRAFYPSRVPAQLSVSAIFIFQAVEPGVTMVELSNDSHPEPNGPGRCGKTLRIAYIGRSFLDYRVPVFRRPEQIVGWRPSCHIQQGGYT